MSSLVDTSLPVAERASEGVRGLLPPVVEDQKTQEQRCLKQIENYSSHLDKFIYLQNLRKNHVHVFYRLVANHIKKITPLVYTPVVGEACQKWSDIYQGPEGMYLSYDNDKGSVKDVINSWPQQKVTICVVTDGSRILGLGDLGVNGMGIPIGKLALYVACAGIHPETVLPITIDLGTSNKEFREDPLYLGSRRDKVPHDEEQAFLDETMAALARRWPGITIQFEDWHNPFYTLERYQKKYTMFNDDMQGTGAVIMGGLMGAIKTSGAPIKEQKVLFFGAGTAAAGVGKQIAIYFMHEGLSEEDAMSRFWFVDSKGLITNDRGDELAEHKKHFARSDNDGKQYKTLEEAADYVEPTILIGLASQKGAFTKEILTKMGKWNKAPIIFPLSNPSNHCECTFEDAVECTDGRVLFAAGSPFDDLDYHQKEYHAAQGNNMFVFPGIGQGTILSKATTVTDLMIYAAGEALPTMLLPEETKLGLLYPDVTRIRDVSVRVTRFVIRAAQKDNVDRAQHLRDMSDEELEEHIREEMYDPFKA